MDKAITLRRMLVAGASLAAIAATTPAAAQTVIEELVVTAQKREEALQDVPIAVSAFNQEALEKAKIDGGPNLVLAVPNVNFSKGNFTGYNFQIRGIGSKLVAASGDAGTGIHLNNAPLIANNLFETEFYDMERVEVLRGPQGTLYGRNATGGVVNLITAKPTDTFSAHARAEYGNYNTMKMRGMVNMPMGDMLALRVAGSYLKRDGYGENLATGNDADDRDLWGGRVTLSFSPTDNFRSWLLFDHFEEDDNRSRIGKQLCTKDLGPGNIGGLGYSAIPPVGQIQRGLFSQGCLPTSLYDPSALGTVNSQATLGGLFGALGGFQTGDAYAGKMQTPDVRDIESLFDPIYKSKTDIYEFNAEFDVTENVTMNWLSAYTYYKLYTRQDYNRYLPSSNFNTTPNPVNAFAAAPIPGGYAAVYGALFPGGVINDPQNGAQNRFTTSDISSGYTEQWSHEVRFQSNFEGPLNYNVGGLITKYNSTGDYYVMFNTGTGYYQINNLLTAGNPNCVGAAPCVSVDPNADPTRLGHNYYDSYGPYRLLSYAAFGELYWQMSENFKWTLGLRYTVDDKRVTAHSVALGVPGQGPIPIGLQKAKFKEPTGRFGFDWQPDVGFTDDTLIYAFYTRGYKGGGLNPPFSPGIGVVPVPATFEPEFINAYEVGTKNTLMGGSLQLNLTGFYYDYKGYQVSKIINRTSINENIDARVMGLEFESIWQPLENLRLNAQIGWLDSEIKDAASIDTFNRTQGIAGLTLVKSSAASNCVVTTAAAQTALAISNGQVPGFTPNPFNLLGVCTLASAAGAGTNIGGGAIAAGTNAFGGLVSEGVPVDLDGNELPNSPHWTVSLGAQYTMDLSASWQAVLRGDYYKQGKTYARIYNSNADRIRGWENVNLTLTVENPEAGLEIGAFVKNATDETAITDFYLTDDSSGLFRNVFYTEPRTYGVSISKRW
ncbi:TonB-dependent receptor [Phenylobacterium sp.]|uniref:TonB-dependent receptor n=1 Tax=Phenylobacterium sp. TaxID=1871053 RepID=UPI002FE111B6